MPTDISNKLVIGISSRALFDLDESHQVYLSEGERAYSEYQIDHENEILNPGVAFHLVEKLLNIKHPKTGENMTEVVLISRNSADTGLRIFNSIAHYGLPVTRAAFSCGESPYPYLHAFSAHLFLSANADDVRKALSAGCAAAFIIEGPSAKRSTRECRIAFDGDAVLFSDDAEKIYQKHGLEAFSKHEVTHANEPLNPGPFRGFLEALHTIQITFGVEESPLRTALITARSAPAHERVIRTLRSWKIRIDEAIFLGGVNKVEFLKAFGADFFFDDQRHHCESTSHLVPTGHVLHGVMNDTESHA